MDTLTPLHRTWRRRVFASTWLCYAGFYFCRKPFYIAKASLASELGVGATALGTIGAAYLVAYTVGQFVSGYVGNRSGARRLLLAGMALSILCNLVFGLANSASTLLVFMVINGLAQSGGWPGTVGTMANWFGRRERGTVMGFWSTNYQAGGVLANALAAWALDVLGFRYSFFLGSAVLLLAWAFFLFNQRDKPEDLGLAPIEEEDPAAQTGGPAGAEGLGWSRSMVVDILLLGTFYFFVKFIRYALWSWAPFFFTRNFHVNGGMAGYLSTLFDLFGIAGVIATGYLSDRAFSGRRAGVSLLMILCMAASCLLLYTVGRLTVPMFALCLGLIGFTLYGPDALLTGAGAMDVGTRRGATLAAGIINGMGSVGSVVQELVVGRLYDGGGGALGPIFVTLLAASAGAACVLSVVMLRNRRGLSNV